MRHMIFLISVFMIVSLFIAVMLVMVYSKCSCLSDETFHPDQDDQRNVDVTKEANDAKEKAFTNIYRLRRWGTKHPNGFGSWDEHTHYDRGCLLFLIQKYGITSMIDVPCGTVSWIVPVLEQTRIRYTGMDIVHDQIQANRRRFPQHTFIHGDMTKTPIGQYDLVFSKEGTQHMTEASTLLFLQHVKRSKSTYLLLTHFDVPKNSDDHYDTVDGIHDLASGAYREQNFLLPPYHHLVGTLLDMIYIRHTLATGHRQYLALFKLV